MEVVPMLSNPYSKRSIAAWIALAALAFIYLLPASSAARQAAERPDAKATDNSTCIAKLHHIYEILIDDLHYSAGLTGFPSDLSGVYMATRDPNFLICPADTGLPPLIPPATFQTSYEIVNDPLKPALSATPARTIAVVAEIRPNHDGERNVLFWDGSVRAFGKAQYDRLKSNSFIDKTSE
jgi:prepilin-type processing-associated H-X9-DG protein